MSLDHDEIDDGATLRFHALPRDIQNADEDALDRRVRRYDARREEWRWPFASTDRAVWPAALDAHRRDVDEWSEATLADFRRDTVRYFMTIEVTVNRGAAVDGRARWPRRRRA